MLGFVAQRSDMWVVDQLKSIRNGRCGCVGCRFVKVDFVFVVVVVEMWVVDLLTSMF